MGVTSLFPHCVLGSIGHEKVLCNSTVQCYDTVVKESKWLKVEISHRIEKGQLETDPH